MEAAIAPETVSLRPPVFGRVLCAIDGSRAAQEAAQQAVALAGAGAHITLMAVACERGSALNAQAVLSHDHAEEALRAVSKLIARDDLDVVTTTRCGSSPARVLLDESAGYDLFVVASHGASRTAGIMVGSTESRAVHEAHVPVLVARRAPVDAPFPTRVLVGADGPGGAESAIAVAARLAESCGASVTLLRVGGWQHAHRHAVGEAAVELAEATGVEPVEMLIAGEPHRELVEVAAREHASLIIVGSRGLAGLRALGSTSERVAHEAPCSVLVLRHDG